MPSKNPRLLVTLEPVLYARLKSLARAKDTRLSAAARALIVNACEDIEDLGLAALAGQRMRSLEKARRK
jgi:predicted DNA-binding protein